MDHEIQLMSRALELAKNAKDNGNEPFGAILVKNGRIIKEGNNQINTLTDPTNHAELGLIRDFCRESGVMDLSDYTLYTSCEPCCMCSGAMVWSKLGTLCYSVSHNELKKIAGSNIMISCHEVFSKSPNRPAVKSGLLKKDGLTLLENFVW